MTLSSNRALVVASLASLTMLCACGGGGGDAAPTNYFVVGSSGFAATGSAPLAVSGPWLAFLADEASSGGQDLNGDGELGTDQVAVAVNVDTKVETNLGVAASEALWVGEELYLVVDEVLDGFDHGGQAGSTDLVLMHWSSALSGPTFVATLDRLSPLKMLAVGSSLFYASDQTPVAATESSLFAIDASFPRTPRSVFTQNASVPLRPRLLGARDGLIFLALDETLEGVALNGDSLADDTHVLALLDGTGAVSAGGYASNMRSTELAIAGASSPIGAASQGAGDWLVGFLVDEASEGNNLNVFDGTTVATAWQIAACSVADSDQTDEVLHVIRFAAWDANPSGQAPINTGLAGSQQVLIAGDAVGTVCLEADENDCVFNGDGDFSDSILRWIRFDLGTAPYSTSGPVRAVEQLLALDVNLPGSAGGIAVLDGAFVVQCDEAADGRSHDADTDANRELIAWLDPQDATPTWVFDHGDGVASYTTATWMAAQPDEDILGIAFAESSNGDDLNNDGDLLDSIPTWPALVGTPRTLTFLGKFLAADKDNAGITLSNGYGFFRFSEVENGGVDSNANGNATDVLLVRVSFASGGASNMGILNNLARPSIDVAEGGADGSAAFLFDETFLGTDLNQDGDQDDLVPRYFRMP